MYGIGVFFALRNAMKAFRPGAELTLDAPMTPNASSSTFTWIPLHE